MTLFACRRVERALASGDPGALPENLARHAERCLRCAGRRNVAESIGALAPSLKKEWESPELFGRIGDAIAAERANPARRAEPTASEERSPTRGIPWPALAATAALFALAAIGLQVFRDRSERPLLVTPNLGRDPLLSESTVSEVDRAEAAYVRSIEKLTEAAVPRLEGSPSALSASYREKLLLLDSAISDLRAEIERNRGNAHLRRELLAIYREKQRTLQDLMKERPS